MRELYVSTDIEADGPIPGPNSMLSFGSAVFDRHGEMIATFTRNLECLPLATSNPDTMKWWATQPEAWNACRKNLTTPQTAMLDYVHWLDALDGKPVFVGYPAGFDFLFIYWYLIQFAKSSPFGFSALDIKTLAMANLGTTYRKTTKRNMPKKWFGKTRHSHIALDDAIEQGELFINILNATSQQKNRIKGDL